MRLSRLVASAALIVGIAALSVGCTSEPGSGAATLAESSDATTSLGGGTDEADTGLAGLEDTAPPTTIGNDCTEDADCKDEGVCYRGVCSQACKTPSDCAAGQDCSLDAKSRLVCAKPAYSDAIGKNCGATGVCPAGTKCLGQAYSALTTCSAACTDDTDCPMTHACSEIQGQKLCMVRKFCNECLHDANCGPGSACIVEGGVGTCAKACNAGSTECPRYAACKDRGDGQFFCAHKAGACVGDGSLCAPCQTEDHCNNGLCLTYNHTKESFCATGCDGGCPAGYNCASSLNKCVPADKANPKCVSSISKMAEVGDIMDDYAMIGMVDTDDDGSLVNEEPRLIKFSDFAAHHELILFNVSAVWCSACQAETKDMKSLYKIYFPKGLVMVQTLFDGQKPGEPMTFPLLKAWNSQLKPSGYVGMDPERWVMQYNVGGSTPLNMIIDAKTRKVLYKTNGYNKLVLEKAIKSALASKGL